MRPFVVWYVREKGARNHFPARGGDLVHLVLLVYLVYLVYLVSLVGLVQGTK